MRRASKLKGTPSSGNVFRDLGFSAEEAEHLLIRADLLIQLQKTIASRRLTQTKAATILRVTQPRVSDLLRGRLDLFSTDTLIDMLALFGVHVRFVLKASRRRLKVCVLGRDPHVVVKKLRRKIGAVRPDQRVELRMDDKASKHEGIAQGLEYGPPEGR